jgi:hypothetical protein
MRKRNAIPRNEREKQARDRTLHALNLIRRKGYALADALRESDTSARTFHKYVGSEVLRSKPGQRLRVTKEDRRIREMPVTTALGDVAKKIHGSKNASLNGIHTAPVLTRNEITRLRLLGLAQSHESQAKALRRWAEDIEP